MRREIDEQLPPSGSVIAFPGPTMIEQAPAAEPCACKRRRRNMLLVGVAGVAAGYAAARWGW